MNVGIYGIGNFGFAIMKHLSEKQCKSKKFNLYAFDRNPRLITFLKNNNKHLYHHKKVGLRRNINYTNTPRDLISKCNIVILSVTSDAILNIIQDNSKYFKKNTVILNTAKALNYETGKTYSQLLKNYPLFTKKQCKFAVLSGGTIASDLFFHYPLGIDIASKDKRARSTLKEIFISDNLNVYTTKDVIGVEYAGSFKNVVSILAGIIKGLGYPYGSETHFITRASNEVIQLLKMNSPSHAYAFSSISQCWGNDLWLSCTGQTRNKEFGTLVGSGINPKTALSKMKKMKKNVEGVRTVKALKHFKINQKKYPILSSVIDILKNNKNPKKVIANLMKSNLI